MKDAGGLVIAVCAAITAIGAAITYIVKLVKPARDLVKRVDKHDELLDRDNNRLKALEKSQSEGNRALCRAVLALLDHIISESDGSDTSNIESARKALNTYLIEK